MTIYRLPVLLKTIIFDIDSTLYTNNAYAHEQVDIQIRRFAELRGISDAQARIQVETYRTNWEREHEGEKLSLGNTLAAFGIPIQTSIRWREDLLTPEKFLEPDARLCEVLDILSVRFSLIVVTNNPMLPAKKTLQALGVLRFFPDIIALDTCGVSKPHRRPFLLAAKKTESEPAQCLAVGDRYDIDIALPLEIGMGGILVSGVSEVYELPRILNTVSSLKNSLIQ